MTRSCLLAVMVWLAGVLPVRAANLKLGPNNAALSVNQRVFVGGITLGGETPQISGTLQASNPTCTLSVPTGLVCDSAGYCAGKGFGPNNSILLNGSKECAGSYELFLSSDNGNSISALEGGATTPLGTGVGSSTFAIVQAADQKTVVWTGTYTSVANVLSAGFQQNDCDNTGIFCANVGPDFGTSYYIGNALAALLILDGFTWNVP